MSRFRLMSYNIMHRLEASRIGKFRYCKPATLAYTSRMPRIATMIRSQEPDIVCLQEVDEEAYGLLSQALRPEFTPAIFLRNDKLASNDGCAIFLRSDMFEVLQTHQFRFCHTIPTHCGNLWQQEGAGLNQAYWREVREKLNMAVALSLQPKGGSPFQVCSTHLYWDPQYPDLKLMQAFLLAKEMRNFSKKCGNTRMILAGDFNSLPQEEDYTSGVYELLTKGRLTSEHPHHPVYLRPGNAVLDGIEEEDMPEFKVDPFKSALKTINGSEPEFTNYTGSFKGCLDYIWYDGLTPVGACTLPKEDEILKFKALPSPKYPSDHLAIHADFNIPS